MELHALTPEVRADQLMYARQGEWSNLFRFNRLKLRDLIAHEIRCAIADDRERRVTSVSVAGTAAELLAEVQRQISELESKHSQRGDVIATLIVNRDKLVDGEATPADLYALLDDMRGFNAMSTTKTTALAEDSQSEDALAAEEG